MKPFKEYIGDILVYLLIAFWLWMLYFWFGLIFIFIKEEDYETKITKSIYQTSSTLELNKSELIRILKKMD